MRVTAFAVAAIVAHAAAAPALSSLDATDCAAAPSITTIYLSSKPSTITVHDAPTSTVYIGAQEPSASEHHEHQPSYTKPSTTTSPGDVTVTYYVTDGSTVYLNSQSPAATEPVTYLTSAVTLTVEPVPLTSTNAQGQTVVSDGETTVYITQQVTVTGTLSAPSSPLTATAPSFTLTGPGGWNGTAAPYHTGPTASSGGLLYSTLTAKLATSSGLAAQSGFGGDSGEASIATSDPTLDVYSSFPIIPLSTMSAQSGFNALTTSSALYLNSTSTDSQATTAISGHAYSTGSSALGTVTSRPSPTFPQSNSTSVIPSGGSFVTSVSSSTSSQINSTATIPVSGSSNFTSATPTIIPTSVPQINRTSTSASTAPSGSVTACGEIGDFGLNFDDIPPLSVGDQDPNTVTPQPVFSPYHQFDWSNGFEVAPPPTDPYLPSSPPQLTMFVPNFTLNSSNPNSGPNAADSGFAGDIANGDHGLTGCFQFNFYGASVGCDSTGPDCVFKFTGLRYDPATGNNTEVARHIHKVAACPGLDNCSLVPIDLVDTFKDLTVLRVSVTVANQPKIWFMDDLRMGWFDNSCEKGVCRQDSHIRKRQLAQK